MNIQRNKRTKIAGTSFAAARTLSYNDPRINFINESSMIHETARTKQSASSRSTERSNILSEGRRIPYFLEGSERHTAPSVHEITNHDDMSNSEHLEKEEEKLNETVYGDRQLDLLIQGIDKDCSRGLGSQYTERFTSFNLNNVFDE
ncbi:predicted protein [Chaetoceros tenuissimus]|uniref:Uncharacterized protein n=1 Tax=Chaetoceros tenuissimus TaxID=426638 RepID=A0AAD3D4H4_9STRA|nr:predicted protein [Chaetoceros tenuissimus]